ncbi:MAG: hypothetical protein VX589_04115 [Myxococcota bacterium]|nr:hypothetical protein [Myxococcota bacterium]
MSTTPPMAHRAIRIDRASPFLRTLRWLMPVLLATLAIVSLVKINGHSRAFAVKQVDFAKKTHGLWYRTEKPSPGFRPIHLPFYRGAGFFLIQFESDQRALRLSLHAQDCVLFAALNGKVLNDKKPRCRNCRITSSSEQKPHCATTVLELTPKRGSNMLAVQTKNVRGPSRSYNIDQTVFWVEYERGGFIWKLFFLVALIVGLGLGWSVLRHRCWTRFWIIWIGRCRRYRVVIFGYVLICTLRVVVSPAHLTTDVNQATHLYVENLVHKTDLSYATLDEDYRAAKHQGRSYMHKPPGLYYQYVPARLYFGFNRFYASYLARLPGLLGDLLIALVLFNVVRRRTKDPFWGNLASILYLFAPGTFLVNGFIGRVDALPVACLLLAVSNLNRWRFIPYLAAAALLKQLAIFAAPWLFFLRQHGWRVVAAGLLTIAAMLPFLLDDAALTFERLVSPQLKKNISGLSWMSNLKRWGVADANGVASKITLIYLCVLVTISPFLRGHPHRVAAFIFVSFLLFARNMAEHYLLWAAPFLIVHFCLSRRFLPLMILGVLQIYGLLANDRVFILVGRVFNDMALVLALPLAVYVSVEFLAVFRPKEACRAYRQRFKTWRAG